MKKILFSFICLLFLFSNAVTLKGGVSEDIVPKGFFGSWGVISKLESTNNEKMFNYESRDVWTLGGYSNVLILQNHDSGAYSEILIKEKPKSGNTLMFERKKEVLNKNGKTIYREKVSFVLKGKNFSGSDNFTVEKYNNQNKLIEKNTANYRVEGVLISGETE